MLTEKIQKASRVIGQIFVGEPENYDFGHAAVFREYAGVAGFRFLRGRYQHGWFPYPERDFWRNQFVPTFVWGQENLEIASKRGWRGFIPVGSSWVYFLKIMESKGMNTLANPEKKQFEELWVFGNHSTQSEEVGLASLNRFIDEARESKVKNKAVILYALDYDRYRSTMEFKNGELAVFTIGPRRESFLSDSHFINLYWILNSTQSLVTDFPTSMVLYALSLGIDIKWHRNEIFEKALLDAQELEQEDLTNLLMSRTAKASEFKGFAEDKLGSSYIKSPEELREIFFWNRGYRNHLKLCLFLISSLWNLAKRTTEAIFTVNRG